MDSSASPASGRFASWLLKALLAAALAMLSLIPGDARAGAPPGSLIISEFRLRGPSGAADEFIEIYNTQAVTHTVASVDGSSGYALVASDFLPRFVISNGVQIPPGGHLLAVNSVGYSLASYPAGNGTTATGDIAYTVQISDNAGIALFRTSNPLNFNLTNRLDAVGSTDVANSLFREGAGYPELIAFSINMTLYRDLSGGSPKDTGDNAADFVFADTNGTNAGFGQYLGAPGPENSTSPVGCCLPPSRLKVSLLDPSASVMAAPNFVRDPTPGPAETSSFGTISIRRKITNLGSEPITRLRFRVVDITTWPQVDGIADLRVLTSSTTTVELNGTPVTVLGTKLEQPPAQPNGGGFNSSLSVDSISPSSPLAPGASIYVQFLLGVEQTGCERLELDVPINYDTCSTGAQIAAYELTCDRFIAAGTGTPASGFVGMRVWIGTPFGPALIDSFQNVGAPAVYAPIQEDGSYNIGVTFPPQEGVVLVGRIYRAPSAAFQSYDLGVYDTVSETISESCDHSVFFPWLMR